MWEWSDHEIALLIEAVKNIHDGAARGTTLKKLSKRLRRIAFNRGEKVGERYRNYLGMNSKARMMEAILYGIPDKLHAPNEDFNRVAATLDSPEYTKLLKEAEALSAGAEKADKRRI